MLDYLDDLDADFRVFYRCDDIESLSGPRFLALAVRVFAYQGVMAARMAEQHSGSASESEVRQVAANRSAVRADPALASLVSWGGA